MTTFNRVSINSLFRTRPLPRRVRCRFSRRAIPAVIALSLSIGLLLSNKSHSSAPLQLSPVVKTNYGGKLEVAGGASWDFGFVPEERFLTHHFTLRNQGAEALRIDRLDPTCDCTALTASAMIIPVGGSVDLTLTFDTKELYGAQTKTFEVHTSDTAAPLRVITYKAVVGAAPQIVDMRPRSLLMLPNQEDTLIKIRNYSDEDIRFRVVSQDSALFSIAIGKGIVGADQYGEILLRVRSSAPLGTTYSTFTLEYATEPATRISTPVKVIRH